MRPHKPGRVHARPRRARVLWLIKGLGPGGAERLLVLNGALGDRTRFQYEAAYVLSYKRHLVGELQRCGVAVHGLDADRTVDARWVLRLWKLLRERGYDIVHTHSPLLATVVRVLAHALPPARRPLLVTTEHNVWSSYAPVTRLLNAATFRLDDAHVAVSQQVCDSVWPPLRSGIEVAVQGVATAEIRALLGRRAETRRHLGLGDDEVAVVTVANLRRQKAYPDLLDAARRVLAHGLPVRFFAVGQGPLEGEIRALHRQLGLGDRFELLGYRPDAVRILAAGDLFVLSSVQEGFPLALMEALVLGVPVVVTSVGGVPMAVRDGVNGFVVPPRRPDLLAAKIAELIRDPQLRREMALRAAEGGDEFDARRSVRRTEELYSRLLASRRPPRAATNGDG